MITILTWVKKSFKTIRKCCHIPNWNYMNKLVIEISEFMKISLYIKFLPKVILSYLILCFYMDLVGLLWPASGCFNIFINIFKFMHLIYMGLGTPPEATSRKSSTSKKPETIILMLCKSGEKLWKLKISIWLVTALGDILLPAMPQFIHQE